MQNILKIICPGLFVTGWVRGFYKGYIYEAKVYQDPSKFGIDKGRISKLFVKKIGKIVANYDRGWDVEPQGHDKKIVEEIINILEGR